ncbi:MAG: hypothetical protein ACRDSK_12330 [Actinophytocola sp.]|uniref:hypothetical protein n=1 Tax=Actinophytocola sp. TaxID=1872138 RepID=UPI003D6B181D
MLLCATFCGLLLVLNGEVGRGRGGATSLLLVIAGFLWPMNFVYEWGREPATYASMCGSIALCFALTSLDLSPRNPRLPPAKRLLASKFREVVGDTGL